MGFCTTAIQTGIKVMEKLLRIRVVLNEYLFKSCKGSRENVFILAHCDTAILGLNLGCNLWVGAIERI